MKDLLKKVGITREELAKMMRVPLAKVNAWCDGYTDKDGNHRRLRLTSKDAHLIARAYGLDKSEVSDICNG